MGTYKRLPRQKMKATDEFVSWTQKTLHWIEHNWRAVLFGIAAVAIVSAVILIASFYAGSRDEKAREMLYEAEKAIEKGSDATTELEKVFDSYPRSGASSVARLHLGDVWYLKGDYSKAVETWKPLEGTRAPEIRILALQNMAAAELAQGHALTAAKIYLKAYNDKENNARGSSYFNAALAYEAAGKTDDAKKIFEDISTGVNGSEYPEQLVQKSAEHLIWLARKK